APHESLLGMHWLHRFASALQPAMPQSWVITPSPVTLHVCAELLSQPMNSSAVQEIGSGTSAGRGKPHAAVNQSRLKRAQAQSEFSGPLSREASCTNAREPRAAPDLRSINRNSCERFECNIGSWLASRRCIGIILRSPWTVRILI